MCNTTRQLRVTRFVQIGLLCLLPLAAGCGSTDLGVLGNLVPGLNAAQNVTMDPADGLTILLPGIEGGTVSLEAARQALRDAGVPGEIMIHQWGVPGDIVTNSSDKEHNYRAAEDLAAVLGEYHSLFPNAPIQVVGYSGGGGLAVLAIEALPVDVRIRTLVLAQSAVNSEYDLTNVLDNIDGEMINLYSAADVLFMGLGTQYFSNVAGPTGNAAGRTGFEVAKVVATEKDQSKLRQVPWTPDMALSGHFGGHLEILGYGWNRSYVAPFLR